MPVKKAAPPSVSGGCSLTVETARVELASSESAKQLSTRLSSSQSFRDRDEIGRPLVSGP
jgi:hypothetical protein